MPPHLMASMDNDLIRGSFKFEWKDNPDTRLAVMAPVVGRDARDFSDSIAARCARFRHGRPVQPGLTMVGSQNRKT